MSTQPPKSLLFTVNFCFLPWCKSLLFHQCPAILSHSFHGRSPGICISNKCPEWFLRLGPFENICGEPGGRRKTGWAMCLPSTCFGQTRSVLYSFLWGLYRSFYLKQRPSITWKTRSWTSDFPNSHFNKVFTTSLESLGYLMIQNWTLLRAACVWPALFCVLHIQHWRKTKSLPLFYLLVADINNK